MAFKMKGNPFNLGKVATKSGVKMAKKAMKMKTESPMPMRINNTSPMRRVDFEYDGDIIDKEAYFKKSKEAQRLDDLSVGGSGVRDEQGEFGAGIGTYDPADQTTIKSFFPEFMTEEEFKKANPNAVSPGPNTTAYAEYFEPYREKLKAAAKKQLQDQYGGYTGKGEQGKGFTLGEFGKLKATGQDFLDLLQYQYQNRGKQYREESMSPASYAEAIGLGEQYRNAIRETKADKQ